MSCELLVNIIPDDAGAASAAAGDAVVPIAKWPHGQTCLHPSIK